MNTVPEKPAYFRTLEGVATAILFGCAILFFNYMFFFFIFDSDEPGWGIPEQLDTPFKTVYGPIFIGTISGFLKFVLERVVHIRRARGTPPPRPLMLIERGLWLLYTLGLSGIVVALAVLWLVASRSIDVENAMTWAGAAAAYWAATLGLTYTQFFAIQDKAEAPVGTAGGTAAPP